ncbi:lipocalin family protein [Antarcticibacterium flavum]|uniref:Lipocalin family protein n=1 Tax=Antarcticibacterium flavum TaxID=2058175 RepID=A0A5B7X5C0_9FLAO|nr:MULTISPECIES: lipocalin family protein [Antarcticibacterium]MCM4159434.1 hypothetical protein [Antarcticibacterium sp. W02-3]QCY69928.1 lipocalin family protein [Antarcticibacterium flavum]
MKTLIILIVILCAGMMNCSGPTSELDYPDPEFRQAIIGKWYPVETLYKGVTYPYAGNEECGRDFLEFLVDNKITYVNITSCEERIDHLGTFNVTGYTLTLTDANDREYSMEIARLDTNSMELIYTDNHDGDGTQEEIRYYSRE